MSVFLLSVILTNVVAPNVVAINNKEETIFDLGKKERKIVEDRGRFY
jgi:hypothetical protein